ncbi:hypothetical protein BDA99DRAFT_606410 [Phascolomyces articulosus]|uniref:OTU domain-containing protein n=1 Tax=Phascolomyces articulosus TaxID=60185 RepID=A0AAD5PBS7_9FUNG|nr:hypothetical protein BDA99DRAFT_606410 [Phascolomyces articulosus]
MRKVNGPRKLKYNVHRYTKKCNGFIQCTEKNCRFFAKQLRPQHDLEQIKRQCTITGCMNCGGDLEHVNTCAIVAHYCFRDTKCTVEQIGTHTHAQYLSKHLSEEEKFMLAERLRSDPTMTPKAAIRGNNQRTGEVVDSVVTINPILATRDRAEYELKKIREEMDIPRRGEFLGEFGKIMNTYPDYFLYAQVVPTSFLVIYRSPIINGCCRFQDFPAVTDVTYKAVEKGYYICTTVIYVPELKRHTVIFQAVLGGLKEEYFSQYFFTFFVDHKVRFDCSNSFLGMMLDFSMAQSNGFQEAYKRYTGKDDGIRYVKGCYMHWMQSVQRINSNHNIIKPEESAQFQKLVYIIRATKDTDEFCRSCKELVTRYKYTYKWIKWWLQPTISSMIFQHCSTMDDTLRRHPYRTTNAVESFHRDLYRDMVHRLPLSLALPQLPNYIQSDVRILANYEEHAVPPAYNRALRPKKKKSSIKKEVNDGRPPDVTKELVDENIILDLSHFDVQQTQERTPSQGKKVGHQRSVISTKKLPDEIVTASSHLLDRKIESFDLDELESMTKEVETGTEEIMQRIMGTDLKKADQEKRKDEKKNNKMSENTPDTMTKKSDRKKKKNETNIMTLKSFGQHQDIPPDCSTGLKQIKADGYCGFRALALQLYGDQDQYQKIKQTMLNHLFANYEFYLDILAKGNDVILKNIVRRLEFGITPETIHTTTCSSDYWFNGAMDTQIAADAYTTPIAVFDERPSWKSFLYLPFTFPSDTNRQPQPINMFLHSNHFSVVDLIPSRARHMVWPAVKPYHEVGWGILGLNVEYNATWKYIHRKRLTQEEKQFLEISDTVDTLDLV